MFHSIDSLPNMVLGTVPPIAGGWLGAWGGWALGELPPPLHNCGLCVCSCCKWSLGGIHWHADWGLSCGVSPTLSRSAHHAKNALHVTHPFLDCEVTIIILYSTHSSCLLNITCMIIFKNSVNYIGVGLLSECGACGMKPNTVTSEKWPMLSTILRMWQSPWQLITNPLCVIACLSHQSISSQRQCMAKARSSPYMCSS